MKRLTFLTAALILSSCIQAQAIELDILKPNFRCQSREFIPDNSVYLTVLQDHESKITHIEVVRSWIGGLRRASYQVAERIDGTNQNMPLLFEGDGIRLAIELTPTTEGASLAGLLQTFSTDRNAQSEHLLCEELR